MKKAKDIFKSFPINFIADFTGTCICDVKHPKFGKHQLTSQQVKYSEGEYKNAIYKNICEQIDQEANDVNSGFIANAKQHPIVNSPLIKLLAKHRVDGVHELNKRLKYPELMEIVDKLYKENIDIKILPNIIKQEVTMVDSDMPYKAEFVFEELGHLMGFEVA